MDAKSLASALVRELTPEEVAQVVRAQHQGYRRTFLVSGMQNPTFTKVLKRMDPDGAESVTHKVAKLG